MAEGKEKGWISLYRDIQDHWIWQDAEKLKAWIDLLLLANHQSRKFLLGNELTEIKRGSTHTSELKLMDRWNWSKKKVRNFLELLEKDNMIICKKSKKGTTITVVNYEVYQGSRNHKGTIEEPQRNHKGYTNNNDNNYNNDNNGNKRIREKEVEPLSIPSKLSNIQSLIFNQFGEVGYKTWFVSTEIIEDEKDIKFIAPNSFTKGVLENKFKDPLEKLLGKKIIIYNKEE